MLKFFRQYNKWILSIGMSVLMVAFLIQPVLSIFQPDPLSIVEGHIGGQSVRVRDLHRANAELETLDGLGGIGMLARGMVTGDDAMLHWFLLIDQAQAAGLWASDTEVDATLDMLGLTGDSLALWTRRSGNSVGFVRQAVRHWLMVEQYRELVEGRVFETEGTGTGVLAASSPGLRRLAMLGAMQQARAKNDYLTYQMLAGQLAVGSVRLSDPLVRAYIQDQTATVDGALLTIRADRYLDQAAEPTGDELATHFATYRNHLPGTSEPYGFGYRVPDRVKIEYLAVPFDAALDRAVVPESEALAAFDQYKDLLEARVRAGASEDQKARPFEYAEARDALIPLLKRQKAAEQVQRVVQAATGRLDDAERSLPDDGRYKALPAGYTPPGLAKLAADLATEFELPVSAQSFVAGWTEADQLVALPGIGQSGLAGSARPVSFADYVLSARELAPAADDPLTAMRLQVGLQSKPLTGTDGTMYLFRLTQAQAAHSLDDLAEVRQQVLDDVKLLKAYDLLVADAQVWRAKAQEMGLDAVAKEVGGVVTETGPIQQSEMVAAGNGAAGGAPNIPGVGRDRGLIDALFDKARALSDHGPLDQTPAANRLVARGVAGQLDLALVRIDGYAPITRSDFQRQAASPFVAVTLTATLAADAPQGSLSLDTLQRRSGYVAKRGGPEDPPPPPEVSPAQPTPGITPGITPGTTPGTTPETAAAAAAEGRKAATDH